MFLINTCMAIPFIIGAQFWWMTLTAVVLGLPLALIQSRDWNASMRRFENWDSLDLDEQRVA